MKSETFVVIIMFIFMILFSSYILLTWIIQSRGIYVPIPNQSTQTVNAATDYFSLTCQQLKDQVNQLIDVGDSKGNYGHSHNYAHAADLIGIMDLKGCQP